MGAYARKDGGTVLFAKCLSDIVQITDIKYGETEVQRCRLQFAKASLGNGWAFFCTPLQEK